MPLALRDDLYFCLTDRGAIFLDLAANRYFGLSGAADIAYRQIIDGDSLDHALERHLRPLLSAGLLHQVEKVQTLTPVAPQILSGSRAGDHLAASGPMAILAFLRHATVRLEMRLFGLKAMISRRRARKAAWAQGAAPSSGPEIIEKVLGAHQTVNRLLGGTNLCLPRSIALIDHLAHYGVFPEMVIGVRTGAFTAHCWVQHQSTVLNDDLDRVRLFTPILQL